MGGLLMFFYNKSMHQFFQTRKQSQARRILYSWPVIGILLFVLAYGGWQTLRAYTNYQVVHKEYEALKKRSEELAIKKENIENNRSLLESNEGRERIIRERFDVQKEGEKTVIFIQEEKKDKEKPASAFHSFTSFFKRLFGTE